VGFYEVADGLRGLAGDLASNAVHAGEISLLIIDGDHEEVLDQKLRQGVILQMLTIFFDSRRALCDLAAQDLSDLVSNLLLAQFDGANSG